MTDTDKNYDSSKPSSPEVKSEPSKPTRIKFDGARAAQLLAIVQGIANVAPGYTNILSEAMAELREMNEEVRKEADKNAQAYRDEQAKKGVQVMPGMPVDPQSSPATQTVPPPAAPETAEQKAERERIEQAKAKTEADAKAKAEAEGKGVTYTSDTNPQYPDNNTERRV